jgi:Family of unknown function (DUF5335)
MTAATQDLDPAKWHEYFDTLTPAIEGKHATIEILDEELGDQPDAERIPIEAISYDPRDVVLEVALGGRSARYPVVLRHFIYSPQSISIEEEDSVAPTAILVTDPSGTRTLISLYDPPALAP